MNIFWLTSHKKQAVFKFLSTKWVESRLSRFYTKIIPHYFLSETGADPTLVKVKVHVVKQTVVYTRPEKY